MAGPEAVAAPRSAQDLFAPVAATVRVLAQVPRPVGDATVVPLDHITAGGLEAVQAEWSVDGGAVVLTGKAPFADLTGRAGFRSDGTLDGTVRMRACVGLLGLNLAEATWSVDGWTPGTPLAAPRITLRGAALAVDLRPLPAGTAWSANQGVNSARTERGAKIDLPKGVVPPGQPLSPRIVEVYRGLLNVDLSRLRVHTGAPAMEEGAPAPEVESAGTKPAVEPLIPASARPFEVPGTPAPAEAAETEAGAAAPAVTEEPATEGGEPGEEEAHAPRTPAEDPDFKQTVGKVGRTRKAQAAHAPPTDKQKETGDASLLPEGEQHEINDRDAHFDEINKTADESKTKHFTPEDFKTMLAASINKIPIPQTEDAAKEFKRHPPLEEAKQSIRGQVKEQNQNIVGPLANKVGVEQPPDSKRPVTKPGELVEGKAGKEPTPISRIAAAPKPRLDNEVSFEKGSASLDELMAKNEMTEDQLAVSNEPQFVQALGAKKEAQQKAAEAPGVYREGEQKVLEKARNRAERAGAKGFSAMFETRDGAFTTVFSKQNSTAVADKAEQVKIQAQLNGIYTRTKSDVDKTLKSLTEAVDNIFSARVEEAKRIFESRVEDQLDDIYGWTRLDDWLFGSDTEAIDAVFHREKERFVKTMDEVIDQIAALIATSLNSAIVRIETGRQDAKTFFDGLTTEQQRLSQEAYNVFQLQFDTLEDSVRAKEQELADTLTESYRSGVDSLQESFDKIKKDVSRSWIGKAKDFVEGAAEVIAKLGELLYSVLSRIANVVGDILAHPIRFIENLASGVGAGFAQFMKNIDEYLVAGFFEWLRGSAGPAIKLPETLDASGLFDLAAQILGLTYENFRKIAVKVWGKAAVELLETGAAAAEKGLEIVQLVHEKGLAGLWEFIHPSLSSLVKELIQNVKESVLFATIDKALAFIAGLFTPVGAFIKAAQAIYRGIRFLMDNIDRIIDIVDAFLSSIELAVAGHTDAIAQKIVNALRGFIVVGIDFLAKLLGLGDLAGKVHKILNAIRAPFERAVEAVLRGLTALVKAVMRKLGLGPRGEKEQPAQKRKAAEPRKTVAAEPRKTAAEPRKTEEIEKQGERPLSHSEVITQVFLAMSKPTKAKTPAAALAEKQRQAQDLMKEYQPLLKKERLRITITDSGVKEVEEHAAVDFDVSASPGRAGQAPLAEIKALDDDAKIAAASGFLNNRVLAESGRGGIGKRQSYLAVVKSVGPLKPGSRDIVVTCAFDYSIATKHKNPLREANRIFPVDVFLGSMGGGYTVVKPFTGGDHKSMYAQVDGNVETGFSLSIGFRKKWRSLFYGTRYSDAVIRYRDKFVDDRTLPQDRTKPRNERHWRYEGKWYVNNKDAGGDATVDHDPPVVRHFREKGFNMSQTDRVDWYMEGGDQRPPEIMPRSVNSEFGSEGERADPYEIGPDFRGPGDGG
jgi:hypothetical protein